MTRRAWRPSGLAFSTYVRFHHTSLTPAKVGDARVRKKTSQVNSMSKCKELCREGTGEKWARVKWRRGCNGQKAVLLERRTGWADSGEIQCIAHKSWPS